MSFFFSFPDFTFAQLDSHFSIQFVFLDSRDPMKGVVMTGSARSKAEKQVRSRATKKGESQERNEKT